MSNNKESKKKGGVIALIVLVILGAAVYFGARKMMKPSPEDLEQKQQNAMEAEQTDTSEESSVLNANQALSNDDQSASDSFDEIQFIKVGDYGGKWEPMESGETAYVFPSGEYARNQWVKDGNQLYYVDVSGCRMINNYSHDGFYVGQDGALVKSVKRLENDLQPREGQTYRCPDWDNTLVFWPSSGKAHMAYPETYNYEVDYRIVPLGHSAYSLYNINDEFDCCYVVVLDDGKTLRVSTAGATEVFIIK